MGGAHETNGMIYDSIVGYGTYRLSCVDSYRLAVACLRSLAVGLVSGEPATGMDLEGADADTVDILNRDNESSKANSRKRRLARGMGVGGRSSGEILYRTAAAAAAASVMVLREIKGSTVKSVVPDGGCEVSLSASTSISTGTLGTMCWKIIFTSASVTAATASCTA